MNIFEFTEDFTDHPNYHDVMSHHVCPLCEHVMTDNEIACDDCQDACPHPSRDQDLLLPDEGTFVVGSTQWSCTRCGKNLDCYEYPDV